MKICIAQTTPIKGAIEKNIEAHKKIINQAIVNNIDLIIFPELSLTGYEPELAKELATTIDDERLQVFQKISNSNNITIGVGLPIKSVDNVLISMLVFQPNKSIEIYSKQHLHADEFDIFTAGKQQLYLNHGTTKIALAICYETSVIAHAENAYKNNATIYLSSVLNSTKSIDRDTKRLSEIASNYKMTVFMSNYAGTSGGYDCAGKSAVWNNKGDLIAQLTTKTEGILIYDTSTGQTIKKEISSTLP